MGGLFFSVSSVSFQALFISRHLLIMILFQEDNIFGTNASLTYVLRYKDIHAFDNNKTMKIIYSMYRAGEVSVHRACCVWATQHYSLGGGGADTIYPGSRPAGVTTRRPRMVTECLLTRSMLIKMYKFTISGYVPVYVHCIYSQSISCRCSLSLFSLFVWHNNSIRKHEYQ